MSNLLRQKRPLFVFPQEISSLVTVYNINVVGWNHKQWYLAVLVLHSEVPICLVCLSFRRVIGDFKLSIDHHRDERRLSQGMLYCIYSCDRRDKWQSGYREENKKKYRETGVERRNAQSKNCIQVKELLISPSHSIITNLLKKQ